MDKPAWASDHGLEVCGQYYQGLVDDYKSVLSQHQMATVTSYGVRKSRSCACVQSNTPKENEPNPEKENEPEVETTQKSSEVGTKHPYK